MNLESREDFLTFTGLFQLVLLVITLTAAHWTEIPLTSQVHWSLRDVVIGLVAAFVMFLSFMWITSVRDQAGEALGKSLAQCRWYDLVLISIMVGIVEEFMFRGFLEQWLAQWDLWGALIIANIVFGLLHAISPLYALLATILGVMLSLLTWWVGDFNLLRPIIAHALYDYIGFSLIAVEYRKKLIPSNETNDESA